MIEELIKEQIAIKDLGKDFSRRVFFLLNNPDLGIAGYLEDNNLNNSNCHGTSLWLIGEYESERPRYIFPDFMKNFILKKAIKDKNPYPGCIISFWNNGLLTHTGVCLIEKPKETLFIHQSDCAEPFELITLESYKIEYPEETPRFYIPINH